MPQGRPQVVPMQGEDHGETKENTSKQDLQHLHQQGEQKCHYTIFDQEEKNGKVIAIKANKQGNKRKGANHIWVPKEIISTMKSTKNVWIPKRK
jgi:hypothetical protein